MVALRHWASKIRAGRGLFCSWQSWCVCLVGLSWPSTSGRTRRERTDLADGRTSGSWYGTGLDARETGGCWSGPSQYQDNQGSGSFFWNLVGHFYYGYHYISGSCHAVWSSSCKCRSHGLRHFSFYDGGTDSVSVTEWVRACPVHYKMGTDWEYLQRRGLRSRSLWLSTCCGMPRVWMVSTFSAAYGRNKWRGARCRRCEQ